MKKIILSIEGMTCSACSNGLEKSLKKEKGVIDATVNLVMATASITYKDNITIKELEKYVENAGFKSLGEENLLKEKKVSIKPFIIYGILGLILMYISMASMINFPIIKYLNPFYYPKIYSITLLILTIPFIIFGKDIIISGIKNLIHKMPNMDTLVMIGVFSSFIYSIYNIILIFIGNLHAVHNLYFESTAFVLYFIKLGRFIDKSSKDKTKDSIKKLVVMTPKDAKLKTKDGYKIVTLDLIKENDILISLPGEKIAVDGIITKGTTHIDESFITGESKPIIKNINDKVVAGSINYEGNIEYSAKRIGKKSTISEIVNLVIDATNTKTDITLLADKLSSYFVPIIIILSILTLIINIILKVDISIALKRFITVLVVACPCALGLATPLAIVVSEGKCARKGILVKKSKVFELGSKIDTIVFDKTGILTEGKLYIKKLINYSKYQDKELLEILGNIEKNSNHPIARGVINSINKENIKLDKEFIIKDLPGYGLKGEYKKDIYYACNSKQIDKLKINNKHKDEELILREDGCSIIYIVKNNEILGLVGIKDLIRKESISLIEKLNKNYEVIMLTGDNKETATKIGKELGIKNIISEVLPKDKSNYILELKNQGKKVIMVGDGINDAPSLINADIGISISSATDIAVDSADVIIISNNIKKIDTLLNICKKTLLNIKENLFWAFFYNICMIPVAMGLFSKYKIEINPMIACIAMIFSSLFVTLNALRLRK